MSLRVRCFIFAIGAVLLQFSLAQACDDTLLRLITGVRPTDEFSKSLLKMCQSIRTIAQEINAFDHISARKKFNQVLKSWVNFSNRFCRNPPVPKAIDLAKWGASFEEITLLLGIEMRFLDENKFKEGHELLEVLVLRMSILSSLLQPREPLTTLLQAELLLNSIKPGFRGAQKEEILLTCASFTFEFSKLHGLIASTTEAKFAEIFELGLGYQKEIEHGAEYKSPRQLSTYSNLSEKFSGFKAGILETTSLEKILPEK